MTLKRIYKWINDNADLYALKITVFLAIAVICMVIYWSLCESKYAKRTGLPYGVYRVEVDGHSYLRTRFGMTHEASCEQADKEKTK